MSDRNKADITGAYAEQGDVEAAWQEMHASAIGPVELGLLADAHEHLTKLHELSADVAEDHLERATELRRLAVDLTWFLPKSTRRPPINDRLEQNLLGELMRRRLWHPLPKGLRASDFGDPAHAAIYSAMERCHASKQPYDLDNVAADLRNKPDLQDVGGTAYLAQLVFAAKTLEPALHVGEAASTISETAHARLLMQSLCEIGAAVRPHDELVCRDLAPGAGRSRAHLLAMDLIGIARDVLDRSAGWA